LQEGECFSKVALESTESVFTIKPTTHNPNQCKLPIQANQATLYLSILIAEFENLEL
jgi:LEA14-like dessication related protein